MPDIDMTDTETVPDIDVTNTENEVPEPEKEIKAPERDFSKPKKYVPEPEKRRPTPKDVAKPDEYDPNVIGRPTTSADILEPLAYMDVEVAKAIVTLIYINDAQTWFTAASDIEARKIPKPSLVGQAFDVVPVEVVYSKCPDDGKETARILEAWNECESHMLRDKFEKRAKAALRDMDKATRELVACDPVVPEDREQRKRAWDIQSGTLCWCYEVLKQIDVLDKVLPLLLTEVVTQEYWMLCRGD